MKREEILEIFNLALDIQEKGRGERGYPCINFETSNYACPVRVSIQDFGFDTEKYYDGHYFIDEGREESIKACKNHLERLKERIIRDGENTETEVNKP